QFLDLLLGSKSFQPCACAKRQPGMGEILCQSGIGLAFEADDKKFSSEFLASLDQVARCGAASRDDAEFRRGARGCDGHAAPLSSSFCGWQSARLERERINSTTLPICS